MTCNAVHPPGAHRLLLVLAVLGTASSTLASSAATESAGAAPELTAEEVVARTVEALGGDAWDAVDTLETRGIYTTFSSPAPFVLQRKRPGLYRFEYEEAGEAIVVGFDGQTAWWENETPMVEVTWASLPPLFYARGFEADAAFGGYPFLDAETQGNRLALIGREEFEGVDAYRLEVTMWNGSVETWWIDAGSFLPYARIARGGFKIFEAENRQFFSDYREVAGGLQVPHRVEVELGNLFGQMTVEAVEAGHPIPDARFHMPLPPVLERLGRLAGEWRVAVATRPLPNLPWMEMETTATVRRLFDGRVLEEEIGFLFAGQPRSLRRTYAYDRFRDRLTAVVVDDLTAHPNLLAGEAGGAGGERIELSNRDTGTAWQTRGMTVHDRQVVYEIGDDSFKVDLDRSMDGGETWITLARFHYVRADSDAESSESASKMN